MQELVEYIVNELVDHPDDVRIEVDDDGDKKTIKIIVHRDDAGVVIGKRGFVVRSIRQLLYVMDRREHKRIEIDVLTLDDLEGTVGQA